MGPAITFPCSLGLGGREGVLGLAHLDGLGAGGERCFASCSLTGQLWDKSPDIGLFPTSQGSGVMANDPYLDGLGTSRERCPHQLGTGEGKSCGCSL